MIGRGRPGQRERGYALVAAVAAMLVFALTALAVIQSTRRAIISAAPDIEQVHAYAAAQAGFTLALRNLQARDATARWAVDGRERRLSFNGATIVLVMNDERGRVPINLLDETLVERLLSYAGVSDEAMPVLRDSLLDWIDEDDAPRGDGAETEYYAASGIRPRNGPMPILGELAVVRGFDSATIARIATVASVDNAGGFEARFSTPAAIDIMYGPGTPDAIQRGRELRGDRTAIELGNTTEVIGWPISIGVTAITPGGARHRLRCVIELTTAVERPYVIRACE